MVVEDQLITDQYCLYQGDCCEVIQGIPDNSVGLSIYSPPFADLYSYSDSDRDMSNSRNYKEFFEHFGFLVEQLYRVLMPGRITAVHCMDLPIHKNREGYIGLKDFPGDIVRLFQEYKFIPHSHHCIWKDPLTAAARTNALGLAHKQIVKDSSMCRTGIPDYIWAFRKPGDNPQPIKHPMGLTEYAGERSIPRELSHYNGHADPKTNKRSHWIWQQYASPVWFDIRQGNVLPHQQAKDKDDQRHICPLQIDVVERCLTLWSNEGDVVLDPFGGVGTTGYVAVKNGRKAIMVELKRSYFRQMRRNMKSLRLEQRKTQQGLLT